MQSRAPRVFRTGKQLDLGEYDPDEYDQERDDVDSPLNRRRFSNSRPAYSRGEDRYDSEYMEEEDQRGHEEEGYPAEEDVRGRDYIPEEGYNREEDGADFRQFASGEWSGHSHGGDPADRYAEEDRNAAYYPHEEDYADEESSSAYDPEESRMAGSGFIWLKQYMAILHRKGVLHALVSEEDAFEAFRNQASRQPAVPRAITPPRRCEAGRHHGHWILAPASAAPLPRRAR